MSTTPFVPSSSADPPHAASAPGQEHSPVTYSFACDDTADVYEVLSLEGTEELGRPYLFTVHLRASSEDTDSRSLLGRDVHVLLSRAGHARTFCGIVTRVVIHRESHARQTSTVEIRPALEALRLTTNTRIFQRKTALEILETVLTEGLRPYRRELDIEALDVERYPTRDYCVQYHETDFEFAHRLMEEEGIGYYFVYDERELQILFDDKSDCPAVMTMDGGPVRFDPLVRNVVGLEPIVRFEPSVQLASTAVTSRDHDWTRAASRVEHAVEAPDHAPLERRHEVYDHGFAHHLTITENHETLATLLQAAQVASSLLPFGLEDLVHDLPGARLPDLTSENSELRTRIRQELLRRDANGAKGTGLVIGFGPGRGFELAGGQNVVGAEHYITKVTHSSAAIYGDSQPGADQHNYHNRFECQPKDAPWRPAITTPKPQIHSVQTATVTGPVGTDVWTDQFGRIKVKFHWDRDEFEPGGDHSCWLRVAQSWAGDGFPGFVFLPRVGMEVIVSFINGDPDRPLVTGCVYNGKNPTPNLLPIQATKSMVRTRTVPHGPGYSELSFEDAMGKERVHIRAQRDLDELVLHNHETRVEQDQVNSVGGDQEEEITGDQRVMIGRHRHKMVAADERETTLGDHWHTVRGAAHQHVGGAFEQVVEGGAMLTRVPAGDWVTESDGRIVLAQDTENFIVMTSEEGDGRGIFIDSQGAKIHMTKDKIALTVGASSLVITPTSIQANGKTMPSEGPQPEPDPAEEWGDAPEEEES